MSQNTAIQPNLPHSPNLSRLREFVQQFTRLIDTGPDEPRLLQEGGALLAALVAHDDWLPADLSQPHPEHYAVVSFVWGPGQATPIHNHTVWGLIGMLRGQERSQPYAQDSAGNWRPSGTAHELHPGQVDAVSPHIGDVHRVSNVLADQVSISIHVYGANIGAVKRSVFLEDGTEKPFVSGYSNRSLPNLWDRSAEVRASLQG